MQKNLDSFPQELKNIDQWLVAQPNGAPCKEIEGVLIPVDPKMYGCYSFRVALDIANKHNAGIGFYLTAADEYCCIDLDVKDAESSPDKPELWTTPEEYMRYQEIITLFDSYAEISRHGKGIHVWIKANIGKGYRRDGVEIYSQERFIICTGNAINNKAVNERSFLALEMIKEMNRTRSDAGYELIELPQEKEDEEIYNIAAGAENSEKFVALFNEGNWKSFGYPSQSEADLSLMSMLAFYSKSNEQCRRLFRYSALGQRDKTTKNNYHVDRLLKIIRKREEQEELTTASIAQQSQALVEKINNEFMQTSEVSSIVNIDIDSLMANHLHSSDTIDWPPGLCGQLAQYLFKASMRPIKEISIVTALGCLAGLCGKAWNIPKSGLNMYIILIARSGIGKEALNGGMSEIVTRLSSAVPGSENFFDFSGHQSKQSLNKAVINNPCFVNINGEIGKIINMMSKDSYGGRMSQIKAFITELYQKSDFRSIVGGLSYSNKENNVSSVSGVAYSLIGESTPDTFYESLTKEMMEDGFLSRFNIIEYKGRRPPSNKNPVTEMDDFLFNCLCNIAVQAITIISSNTVTMVKTTPEAANILEDFDLECDHSINANDNESIRQIWNRAHLKVLRLAGLLAVADNWITPIISVDHVKWALQVVRIDMTNMFNHIKEGDVGVDDSTRLNKAVTLCLKYLSGKLSKSVYGRYKHLAAQGIITKTTFQVCLSNTTAFRNHSAGSNFAINGIIKTMLDMGLLIELPASKRAELKYRGKAYYVSEDIQNHTE